MRFSNLLDRQERGDILQEEAAEMLGVHVRTFQRWAAHYEDEGEAVLADRRVSRRSPRRAPQEELERMPGLYREKYAAFAVKHFHEQLVKRHGYKLGHTVTKRSSQEAAAASAAGMMLHQTARVTSGSRAGRRWT
jgi:transposase